LVDLPVSLSGVIVSIKSFQLRSPTVTGMDEGGSQGVNVTKS
jgi:hypothetical protein